MKTNNSTTLFLEKIIRVARLLALLLIFSLAALAVHADFNGTDNFSSGSGKWDAFFTMGTTSQTVTNGRYEYTHTGASLGEDLAVRRWNVNRGSYTNDWAVQVDVHLSAFPGLPDQGFINLNLGIQDSANSDHAYAVAIDRYYNGAHVIMDFYSGLGRPTTEIVNTTTDAALRISFDSAAKTLTAWYDADGVANGYTWIPMETVSIATGINDWGMTAASQFNVVLAGGSGNITVTGDQAYFDNFLAASGPCPTNAFTIANIIPNGSNGVISMSAAFDGTNYLVGIRGDQIHPYNIYAQLVSQAGTPVGSLISVGRTSGRLGAPLVAFDGANYLMVWADDATYPIDKVYGQFVSRAGVLVGSPFLISAGADNEEPGGIAFDGTNYLVMYGIGPEHSPNRLAARFVSPAGVVSSEITLATGDLRSNAVAFNGTNYLIAWMQHNGDGSNDVYGVLVSKTGTISAPFRISQYTSVGNNPMNVASDGSNFFVVWHYSITVNEPLDLCELHGRLVTAGGWFGSSEFTVAGLTNQAGAIDYPFFPFIAFDGANYFVTWTDRSNINDWNITGQFVTKTGALLGSALSLVTCPGNQAISPVIYGAGKDLVLWTDGITPNYTGTAIRGLFIPVVGQVHPQVQISDASFGVRTNRFGFNITGSSNLVIVVEACTNLAHPIWTPLQTNTLTGGSSYFSDPRWTNYPGRFYRLRSP